MSYDDNLQQMQDTTTNDTSASDEPSFSSASNSACEPMFESEAAEYNEEFLKALLNDSVDFETASLSSTNSIQQGCLTTTEQQSNGSSSSNSSGTNGLQPNCSPQQLSDHMLLHCSNCSPANLQPLLQSNAASSKRIIKPRAQLSNQEITRLLLMYMSKALTASQQSASSERRKQGCNSHCMQASSAASKTVRRNVRSSTSGSMDLLQLPKPANTVGHSKYTDLQQSTADGVTSKSKRKCKKSKSVGTSATSCGLEPMDCSVTASKEVHRNNAHTKVRPFNSLDLPKVHDPLGLMEHTEDKMHPVQQPKVLGTGKRVTKDSGGTAMEASSSEMDLSPLAQMLETVKTVPNFGTATKPKANAKSAEKNLSAKEQREADNKTKKVSTSSDQMTPISDIFNTVNNLPNLSDIQSVLKYVQKRRAMRKLYRRRSHSAGSIDDLKKESKSSASLKAYTDLLKAKSQRLQRHLVPDQSLMNLQSCMTTHSAVNDNNFEFLRSIGIDPNAVTDNVKQNDSTSSKFVTDGKGTQLLTETPTGFSSSSHSKGYFLPLEAPSINSQLLKAAQCPNTSSDNNHLSVVQCGDMQNLDHEIFNLQMPVDSDTIASELNHMEEDNPAIHTAIPDVYFTPEWAHTQGMIKVLIHGPFISSPAPYVCYFGDQPVEAKMEQWGILTCVCPAQAPGFVTVKVVCRQNVYTCSQQFEYRSLSMVDPNDNFNVVSKEDTWRSELLCRIEVLAKSCSIPSEVKKIMDENRHIYFTHFQFEQLVLHMLEKLKSVCSHTALMELKPNNRTTILHLAVLLSLEQVVKKIKELILLSDFPHSWESEFSPWTQDEEMCSPLMLSCQQGNVTISKLLLEWEPETITLTNFGGVTPVQCALQRGHTSMVTKLENWITAISENQTNGHIDDGSTESDVRQCPYSANVYPMSSELYATELEDVLQSSSNDLLQSHQLNEDKEIKERAAVATPLEKSQSESTLSANECRNNVITGIKSVGVHDNTNFSSSPMFVTTNPCMASNNVNGLTVNELASGSSSMFTGASHEPTITYTNSNGGCGAKDSLSINNASATPMSSSEPCHRDIPIQFGEFRINSPLLSSPSEQSSVISASPSSLSAASDSCSVAEICELLGESPSVCQQDFSFPGLSDSEQQEIFHAARTIQHAFRKHKIQAQRHRHSKEKHAAVLIETYYKKYKEMQQMNRAAVLIQKYYRRYRNSLARSKELERAALFIQQMYRYQHRLKKR